MSDANSTTTEIADEFEAVRMFDADGNATGAAFDYNLFTPEKTDEPMPLVLELHGSGDYLNLLQNRIATAWAEPQNQADRPCYVLAPLFQDGTTLTNDEVLEQSYLHIKKMIEEGKVDPNRVYVIGKSMGGRNCFIMLTRYNDIFAAGIVLCGSVDSSLTPEEIANVKDTPVYVIYGEMDNTDNKRGIVYDTILETGNTVSHERVYTKREMDNRGIGGTHHDVEIICMEDISYMVWLFEQSLN